MTKQAAGLSPASQNAIFVWSTPNTQNDGDAYFILSVLFWDLYISRLFILESIGHSTEKIVKVGMKTTFLDQRKIRSSLQQHGV